MKKTNTFLVAYEMTDELADFLIGKGKTIICISYGYTNGFDLVIWED